jgi:hypothetical protein
MQVALLAWEARSDSVTWDEIGHFAAGLDHLRHGRFDMFIVNPPLVRSLAMIPVALTQPSLDPFVRGPGQRPEFISGALLARSDFRLFSALLTLARRSCIPLAVIGGWICYIWARELWANMGVWLLSSSGLRRRPS